MKQKQNQHFFLLSITPLNGANMNIEKRIKFLFYIWFWFYKSINVYSFYFIFGFGFINLLMSIGSILYLVLVL